MPGPPPTPTRLKLLAGNPGKRPLNENEPQPLLSVPECPEHLGDDARSEWLRIVPELESLGLLSQIDRAALAAYCTAYGRWTEAERELQANGLVFITPNGHQQASPYLSVANKALAQLRQFIQEFGLSPASRSRVHAQPKDDDADADFFGVR